MARSAAPDQDRRIMKRLALLLTLALVASTPVAAAEAAAQPGPFDGVVCLGTAAAQEAVREGRVRRLAEIGHGLGGEVLRAELCRRDDAFLYRITVLDRSGRVRSVAVDAATGRMLYDGR
jgi:hypothetical protein